MTNYSETINLPKTKFSMKANLSEKETQWLEFWRKNKIYDKLKKKNNKNIKYVLHDGPPYANGDLHLGHALNKILKDVICRFKFQSAMNVEYVVGIVTDYQSNGRLRSSLENLGKKNRKLICKHSERNADSLQRNG